MEKIKVLWKWFFFPMELYLEIKNLEAELDQAIKQAEGHYWEEAWMDYRIKSLQANLEMRIAEIRGIVKANCKLAQNARAADRDMKYWQARALVAEDEMRALRNTYIALQGDNERLKGTVRAQKREIYEKTKRIIHLEQDVKVLNQYALAYHHDPG